jgi:hypothetical protein
VEWRWPWRKPTIEVRDPHFDGHPLLLLPYNSRRNGAMSGQRQARQRRSCIEDYLLAPPSVS